MRDTSGELQEPPVKRKRGRPPLSWEDKLKRKANREANADARRDGQEPAQERDRKGISRELRTQVLTALTFVGGVDFLVEQARKPNNTAFMALLGKCLIQEDGSGDSGLRIVVQQLNITQAQPVAGVLNSPIAGHIAPPRLVVNGGEVVDMEEGPGNG